MISNTWKLASVLGVAGAIALSAVSAEARDARKTAPARGATASDPYAYRPSFRGSYNYRATPRSGGVNSGEPNGPDNYNRNSN
jgi:hypothetical protein